MEPSRTPVLLPTSNLAPSVSQPQSRRSSGSYVSRNHPTESPSSTQHSPRLDQPDPHDVTEASLIPEKNSCPSPPLPDQPVHGSGVPGQDEKGQRGGCSTPIEDVTGDRNATEPLSTLLEAVAAASIRDSEDPKSAEGSSSPRPNLMFSSTPTHAPQAATRERSPASDMSEAKGFFPDLETFAESSKRQSTAPPDPIIPAEDPKLEPEDHGPADGTTRRDRANSYELRQRKVIDDFRQRYGQLRAENEKLNEELQASRTMNHSTTSNHALMLNQVSHIASYIESKNYRRALTSIKILQVDACDKNVNPDIARAGLQLSRERSTTVPDDDDTLSEDEPELQTQQGQQKKRKKKKNNKGKKVADPRQFSPQYEQWVAAGKSKGQSQSTTPLATKFNSAEMTAEETLAYEAELDETLEETRKLDEEIIAVQQSSSSEEAQLDAQRDEILKEAGLPSQQDRVLDAVGIAVYAKRAMELQAQSHLKDYNTHLEKLTADVRAERESYFSETKKLNEQNNALQESLSTTQARVNQVNAEKSNLKSLNQKLIDETKQLRSSIERLTAENSRLTAENSCLTADSNRLTADNSRLTADNSRLTADNGRIQSDAAEEFEDSKRKSDADNKLLEKRLNGLLTNRSVLQNEIGSLKQRNKDIEAQAARRQDDDSKQIEQLEAKWRVAEEKLEQERSAWAQHCAALTAELATSKITSEVDQKPEKAGNENYETSSLHEQKEPGPERSLQTWYGRLKVQVKELNESLYSERQISQRLKDECGELGGSLASEKQTSSRLREECEVLKVIREGERKIFGRLSDECGDVTKKLNVEDQKVKHLILEGEGLRHRLTAERRKSTALSNELAKSSQLLGNERQVNVDLREKMFQLEESLNKQIILTDSAIAEREERGNEVLELQNTMDEARKRFEEDRYTWESANRTFRMQAEQPPFRMQAEQSPLRMVAEQPPFRMQAEQPPFRMQAEQPPLRMQAEQPPLRMQAEQPSFRMQAEQPPLRMQAEQPSFRMQAEQPPLRMQAEQPPTVNSTAQSVDRLANSMVSLTFSLGRLTSGYYSGPWPNTPQPATFGAYPGAFGPVQPMAPWFSTYGANPRPQPYVGWNQEPQLHNVPSWGGNQGQPQPQYYESGNPQQSQAQYYEGGNQQQPQTQYYEGGNQQQPQTQYYEGGNQQQPQTQYYEGGNLQQPQTQYYESGNQQQQQPPPQPEPQIYPSQQLPQAGSADMYGGPSSQVLPPSSVDHAQRQGDILTKHGTDTEENGQAAVASVLGHSADAEVLKHITGKEALDQGDVRFIPEHGAASENSTHMTAQTESPENVTEDSQDRRKVPDFSTIGWGLDRQSQANHLLKGGSKRGRSLSVPSECFPSSQMDTDDSFDEIIKYATNRGILDPPPSPGRGTDLQKNVEARPEDGHGEPEKSHAVPEIETPQGESQ